MESCLKVPLADRQQFWTYQHGEVCMGLVLSLCDRLRPLCTGHYPDDVAALYGEIIGLYTLYGRPFKQRPPLRLPNDVVPKGFENEHQSLISFRDKLFAHVDQGRDAIKTDDGEVLGKMVLIKSAEAFQCTMSSLLPRFTSIDHTADLAQRVRRCCQERLQAIFTRYNDDFDSFDLGLYEVNIDEPQDGPIFRPVGWT